MLSDNRNEPLKTAQNRTVDHYRSRRRLARIGSGGLIGRAVLEVEPLWQLEVELNGGTLERPAESITDGDVDFGAVECSIAGVDFPATCVVELVTCHKCSLCRYVTFAKESVERLLHTFLL